VTFKDGTTTLGTATLSGGSATYATSTLAVGSHSITAAYGGDTNDNSSTSSTLTQTVNNSNPVITGLSPTTGTVGTEVTISGSGFGATQGTSTVSLNSTNAAAVSWSDANIVAVVPVGATSGPFSITVNSQIANSSPFAVTALPEGWLDQDIGQVGLPGSAAFSNGVFTINEAGGSINNVSFDALHFVYQSLSGDGTIIARIANAPTVASYPPFAGVMIRESLSPTSTNAYMSFYSGNLEFSYRPTTAGSPSTALGLSGVWTPYWVKLVRSGSTFSGYYSANGVDWVQVGSNQTISMAQNVYVGLALTCFSQSPLSWATIDNVYVTSATDPGPVITNLSATTGNVGSQVTITGANFGTAQGSSLVLLNGSPVPVSLWGSNSINITIPAGATSGPLLVSIAPNMNDSNAITFTVTANPLPSGWLDTDIGAVSIAGTATFSGDEFTINEAGGSINNVSFDALHFVYQPLSGDGTIIARIVSASTVASYYPFVGVMIRESLSPTSTNAYMAFQNGNLEFSYRPTTGGSPSTALGLSGAGTPYWVKLVRSVGTFSGYYSSNGIDWVQVGATQTITMAQNVYVGLALTCSSQTPLSSATVDSVSINSFASSAPVITNISATTGQIGAQVVITGANFGASQGNSAVFLNDVQTTIDSWSDTSIAITIPVGATSGPIVVSVAPDMVDSNPIVFTVTTNALPSGWLDADIGFVGIAGSATYANGVFTISGSGQSIYGSSDEMHFVFLPLSGDGTIIARVLSAQGSNYPEPGVMIRETLNDGSANAFTSYRPGSVGFSTRPTTGANTTVQGGFGAWTPYWLMVVRSGNTLSGYASFNGVDWTQVGTSQTVTMAPNVFVGLGLTSQNNSNLATATFDSVSVSSSILAPPVITSLSATTGTVGSQVTIYGTGFGTTQGFSVVSLNGTQASVTSWSSTAIGITIPTGATSGPLQVSVAPSMLTSNAIIFTVTSQPLPNGWLDTDVGQVGIAGSATYTGDVFTVQASGTSINGYADAMHFVYQPLASDGTIVARLVSITGGTNPQAGVMIRETLTDGSTHAFSAMENQNAWFWDRSTTGGGTNYQSVTGGALPYWIKLVRNGSTFIAYTGPDGVNWTQIGTSDSITMAQNAYIGLALSSDNNSETTIATFDNVSITLGTTPIISNVTPASGPQGTQVTITGVNFGSSQGSSAVNFSTTPATSFTSWADNQIVTAVPIGATTGPVTVVVNSVQSNTNFGFLVINPVIASLTPPVGQAGATISLAGSGFGPSQGSSSVMFNGVSATVSFWSDASITVTVPSTATSGPVTVSESGVISNSMQFSVEALSITGISANIGQAGDSITITGTGFGTTQSNSTVDFYGTMAAVQSWNDTQIVATVPANAGTGTVDVSVGGVTWYGMQFNMTTWVDVTDSKGNQTLYSSVMVGGVWVPYAVTGSGCSTCSIRGNISYEYDDYGHVLSRTDENGHTTTYTYDSQGNVLTVTVPISASVSATTTYTYNSFGEVLTATDPLGNVMTNTYDANGNLLSVTTPTPGNGVSASVTQFAYNPLGELTTITDPLNNQTTLAYTPAGLIQTITDAQQNVTTYGYDLLGNRTSVKDALGNTTAFTYDAMSRLTKITYPDSTTTQFGYDSRGRRTSVTDQNQKTTTYAYDDADRLITVTDAANNVTTYGYDTESNLTSIKDANQNTTNFAYDAYGRVTQTTFPSGYVETYGYDNVGNLTSKTDRKNQLITYTYDQLNRLTQKSYPDTSTVNYTYDNDSRLTQVSDPTGTYQFTFDDMGRLTGTSTQYAFLTSRTFTTSYGYDAASNRTSFTDPENGSSSYVYDTLNRLQTLTPPTAYGAGSFGLGYDALSRRTSLTRPNTVNTSYGYDSLSRLLSVTHAKGGATLGGAAYTVDNAGNRTAKSDLYAGVTTNYGYDNIYELLNATQGGSTTESYTYDPVGNRLTALGSAAWNYNTSNELNSRPGASYAFDANGNTTSKTDSTGTTNYTWDYDDRLTSATLPGSGGTVSYRYDPFGRRIYKSSSAGTSMFAYDADNLIEETNSTGGAVARYSQGLNIDEPLAELRSATTSYYQADGLGSITTLSNAAGAVAANYSYDSFGNITAASGSIANNFRYTGREWDSETSFYYYRARYYDPASGRFLSEDPIGFNGGVNFFSYTANSPLNLTDPSGNIIVVRSNDPTIWPITLVYLCGSPAACQLINELQASSNVYVINISDAYHRDVEIGMGTIFWNPHQALCVKNGVQSPAIQLLHEMEHAWQWKNNLPPNEEQAVQLTNPAAKQLGEPIRLNYADAGKKDPIWPMSIPTGSKKECGCETH
jgi:RHS repeat-associated protein